MWYGSNGVVSSSQSADVSNGVATNGTTSLKASFASDSQGNGASAAGRNGTMGKLAAGVGGNGVAKAALRRSDYFGHDREEVARILIQALVDLGYPHAASTLEEESEYTLESPCVANFRKAILRGDWGTAERLLYEMEIHQDADFTALLFYIRRQKFLELLEMTDTSKAIQVLRTELTPLGHDMHELHFLSTLMMCMSPEDLRKEAKWDGAEGSSRQELLSELSKFISPSVMLPNHRLADLFSQVKQTQMSKCLYHNAMNPPSLYTDHMCDSDEFPSVTSQVLRQHADEVYCVKFSHDGRRIASSGKDALIIIWDVETWEPVHIMRDSGGTVTNLDWSPDNSRIVSAGYKDRKAKVWNTETGECLETLAQFEEPVTAASWHPNGKCFITSSMDPWMILWDSSGQMVKKVHSERFYDIKITDDGGYIVAVDDSGSLYVYDFADWNNKKSYPLEGLGRAVQTSQDSRHAIVTLSHPPDNSNDLLGAMKKPTVALIELATGNVKQRYVGYACQNFVVRATFGGPHEHFVVSGSEDANIYVWHKLSGQLVVKLPGHTASVNSISWNPAIPLMFASASDDHTIRIWSNGVEYNPSSCLNMKGILNPATPSNGFSSHRQQVQWQRDPYQASSIRLR